MAPQAGTNASAAGQSMRPVRSELPSRIPAAHSMLHNQDHHYYSQWVQTGITGSELFHPSETKAGEARAVPSSQGHPDDGLLVFRVTVKANKGLFSTHISFHFVFLG